MPIGDSFGTILLATSKGIFSVSGQVAGPYYNAQHQRCMAAVAQFVISRYSQRQPQEEVVSLVISEGGDSEMFRDTITAVAPHILKEFVESSNPLPIVDGRKDFVDVCAWLKDKQCESVPVKELAVYLDGSKAIHNRLCYEDIVRVLLHRYEEEGPCSPLAWDKIGSLPMMRRYYEQNTLTTARNMLLTERKITGTRADAWIVPDRADELREWVRQVEENSLVAPPLGGTFALGKPLQAWQELRSIVKSAQHHVWFEDAWLGSDVVDLLGEDLPQGVSVRVLGPVAGNRHWDGALAALKRLGLQVSNLIEVRCTTDSHERYVYVDGRVWRSSESFKDLAKTKTTRIVPELGNAEQLIAGLNRRWAEATEAYSNREEEK